MKVGLNTEARPIENSLDRSLVVLLRKAFFADVLRLSGLSQLP